jgi:hypothetical protein
VTVGGDHPDWQDYVNWRGPNLGSNFTFPLSSTNEFTAQGYVTNYQAIIVNVAGEPANGCSIELAYYTDDTLALFMGNQNWQIAFNQTVFATVPVLGNYVVITVSTATVATTDTSICFTPSNTPAQSTRYNSETNYIQGESVNIPASSSIGPYLQNHTEGPGYVWVRDDSTSGKLNVDLRIFNQLGVGAGRISRWETGITDIYQSFIAPKAPLGLVISNTDTVAHLCSYYLAVDGR